VFLAACKQPISPSPTPTPTAKGAPKKASIAGAKGLFLASTGAAKSIAPRKAGRSLSGRDIVASSGASLGAVTAAGVPETASWTDGTGATVNVTITQALQLTPVYVLISYSGDETGLGVLNMTSGALASVSSVPDNWSNIYALGAQAWYISADSLVRLGLDDGIVSTLSTGSEVWGANISGGDNVDQNISTVWPADTWVYADASGNAYAMEMQNTQSYHAVCVTSGGLKIDFGMYYNPMGMLNNFLNGKILIDQNTGMLYYIGATGTSIPDPNHAGSWVPSGFQQNLFLITFSPSIPGVISYDMANPVATCIVPQYDIMTGFGQALTHIGFGNIMQSTILTDGVNTYTLTPTSISVFDTSSVPVSYYKPGYGDVGAPFVQNWTWSGGNVFTGTTTQVGQMKLNGSSATNAVLLNDPSLISWSVVGGDLFYTDGSGTYQAPINTSAGTLGAASAYSGGAVTAVTQ
jgi:hypothetical protein